MHLKDLEEKILLKLIITDVRVSLYPLSKEYKVSVRLLIAAIQNLESCRYLERNEDIIKIFKMGISYLFNKQINQKNETNDSKVPVGFLGKKININEFYIPEDFKKISLYLKKEGGKMKLARRK
jgi:hypothetical protein